jgi:hypothetical protein
MTRPVFSLGLLILMAIPVIGQSPNAIPPGNRPPSRVPGKNGPAMPKAPAPQKPKAIPKIILPMRVKNIVTEQRKDAKGRDYWIHRPKKIQAGRPYFLLVAAHGYGGTGKDAAGFQMLVYYGNCIVVCPTFVPDYIALGKGTDKQLLDLFTSLKKEFSLHDKLFVTGFSGGSQYAHRFTLRHPQSVLGCGAHAGGSWCTDPHARNGDEKLSDKIRDIPFVVSCGTSDKGRIDGAMRFAHEMTKRKYCIKEIYWAGLGHMLDVRAFVLTIEGFFFSAYGLDSAAGVRFDKRVDTACKKAATASYSSALSNIRLLQKIRRTELAKEKQPLNAPKRIAAPNAAGWHTPPSKTNWLDEHFERCKTRWVKRLVQIVTDRAVAEVKAMSDPAATRSRSKIKAILRAFTKHPAAAKQIEAAATR